ncbi:helix-turn-helix transcriptional regulator [Streptomyces cucumeris]|uniref:helix-turn-helix transcriptional regulator n=1 Tax=Streptomyces cucumeris TaxID=2962890 RepID=UPI003D739341
MTDTPARLLTLLSLLQTPREWPGSELAERLGVSHRTIRRDIERLRDLGYPVDASRGATGGYRLVAGTAMPPLLLDDEEAVAIAVGLRTAAGHTVEGIEEASVRALAKLEQVLPSRLRRRVGALGSATVPLPPAAGGPTVDPERLTALAAAVAAHERLRFAYRAGDGTETRRLVEPHRLVASGRRWYLVAYDNEREDWRTFRVDRVHDPRPTGVRTAPRALPGEDAAAFVSRSLRGVAPAHRAVATVRLPCERVAGLLPGAEVERLDEDRCRVRTATEALEWLAFRLVLLDAEFEVHEPPELIAYLRVLGGRALRAANAPTSDSPPTVTER